MVEPNWLAILPPLIAILLAIVTKEIYSSLLAGVFLGSIILCNWNPLSGTAEALARCVQVFEAPGNTRNIIFTVFVGSLTIYAQRSGGIEGFINWARRNRLITGKRSAGLLAFIIGVIIFFGSTITCLVTGAISRPIFDKYKISREKLAYIIDSTSAPICIMIPINAWGALIIGMLEDHGVQHPIKVLLMALFYNYYSIFALLLVLTVILLQKDFGPMRKAEQRAQKEGKLLRDGASPLIDVEITAVPTKEGIVPKSVNLIVPVAVMLTMTPLGLVITGHGDFMQGSGSIAVYWGVIASLVSAMVLYRIQGIFTFREIVQLTWRGAGGLISVAAMLVLAFALGRVCADMGLGTYASELAKKTVSPRLIPVILFLISAFIAFSTGTSWGTFAIMVPIAISIATKLDINMSLLVGSVLSGAIFGDHSSPISDTTIVSSMAAASDHIDHVTTQIPYAMSAAMLAAVFYLIV